MYYDFKKVSLVINGVEIEGWAEGDDVLTLERRSELKGDVMGAGGDMMVYRNTDDSGTFSFNLLQNSESNKYLTVLANEEVFVPVTIQFADSLTGDLGSGSQGYIQNIPTMTRGVGANTTTWVVVVEKMTLLHGGV